MAKEALPGVLPSGVARIVFELKSFFGDPAAVVFTLVFPLLLLVVFGSVFTDAEMPGGVSFSQYFTAGMIASGVLYTAFQGLVINLAQERQDGTLKRLGGTPMPKSAFFIGKIGLYTVLYVAQVVILLGIGIALYDLSLPSNGFKWFTLLWISVVSLVAWTLLGVAFSVVPKSSRAASAIVTPIVLILQFTSGVFFVYNELPEWMQQFAAVFPLKWMTQGMRSVFLPETYQTAEVGGGWELPMVALVLGLWALAGLVLALAFFRWTPRGQR
jgi:ABC-2 type transport system permease protein